MLSILTPETVTVEGRISEARPSESEALPMSDAPLPEKARVEEFEIVLGRRQVASLSFVVTVAIVIFSAFSYLAGKALETRNSEAAITEAKAAAAEPPPLPVLTATIAREAEVPAAAAAIAKPVPQSDSNAPEPQLFAEPRTGVLYIQMAAVEKGISMVFAQGLRKNGLNAFVAPGPSEKIFRVLIGPLPNAESYQQAKAVVDRLGLTTFMRKYQN